MDEQKKRRGPAPLPRERVKRVNFTVRMLDAMKARLDAAASKSRRSISEEVEHRLVNSLDDDERFGDLESQMFGRLIGETINRRQRQMAAEHGAQSDEPFQWWQKHQDRNEVREAIIDVVESQLKRSERWWPLPPTIMKQVLAYREATTGPNSSYEATLLKLLRDGLEKNGFPVESASGEVEGRWISLPRSQQEYDS
jgi:hypothetical protein